MHAWGVTVDLTSNCLYLTLNTPVTLQIPAFYVPPGFLLNVEAVVDPWKWQIELEAF